MFKLRIEFTDGEHEELTIVSWDVNENGYFKAFLSIQGEPMDFVLFPIRNVFAFHIKKIEEQEEAQ